MIDHDGASLQAILAIVKEQEGRAGDPVQQHANLKSILLQFAAVGYVNGMEWGFHDVDHLQESPYSIRHHLPVAP